MKTLSLTIALSCLLIAGAVALIYLIRQHREKLRKSQEWGRYCREDEKRRRADQRGREPRRAEGGKPKNHRTRDWDTMVNTYNNPPNRRLRRKYKK